VIGFGTHRFAACNHPSLVTHEYLKDSEAIEPKAANKEGDEEVDSLADALGGLGVSVAKKCNMCQTEYVCITARNAPHPLTLCRLKSHNTAEDKVHCSDCTSLVRVARRKSVHQANSNLPPDSAKIRKIIELLEKIESREDETGEPTNEKTIVFSQFTSMLDIIEIFLKAKRIKFARCKLHCIQHASILISI
jgi:SNF2 family DNA or RNA helicase